jgi:hypothetical protein
MWLAATGVGACMGFAVGLVAVPLNLMFGNMFHPAHRLPANIFEFINQPFMTMAWRRPGDILNVLVAQPITLAYTFLVLSHGYRQLSATRNESAVAS